MLARAGDVSHPAGVRWRACRVEDSRAAERHSTVWLQSPVVLGVRHQLREQDSRWHPDRSPGQRAHAARQAAALKRGACPRGLACLAHDSKTCSTTAETPCRRTTPVASGSVWRPKSGQRRLAHSCAREERRPGTPELLRLDPGCKMGLYVTPGSSEVLRNLLALVRALGSFRPCSCAEASLAGERRR